MGPLLFTSGGISMAIVRPLFVKTVGVDGIGSGSPISVSAVIQLKPPAPYSSECDLMEML